MYLAVKKVNPQPDYKLQLTFENMEVREFDMNSYLNTGAFKSLKDVDLFNRVKISFDTVEWPNGVDLDPEVLYSESTAVK